MNNRVESSLGSQPSWIKRHLPKTLFGRALLIIVTPLVLMQAISAFIFYDRHWDIMTRRLVYGLAGEIAFMISELEPPVTQKSVEQLSARARDYFDLEVTWRDGAILPNQPAAPLFGIAHEAMAQAMDMVTTVISTLFGTKDGTALPPPPRRRLPRHRRSR